MLSTGTFCPVIAFRRPCPTLWASRSYPERSTLLQLQNWVRHGRAGGHPRSFAIIAAAWGRGLVTRPACRQLGLHVDPALFRIMVCLRLRLPVASEDVACPLCDAVADRMGDHARACPCGGDRTKGHHRLRSILASRAQAGGLNPVVEKAACSHHVWILQVLLKMVCKPTVVVAGGRPTSGLETGGRMARPLSTWRSPLACDKGLWLPQQQQGPVLQKITKPASGLICRRRLPVLMRVSNSSPWSPRLPAEVGHRWPCKPGGNLRTAWPRALVKRPALSLASCCKLWQSAFSVKTRELSSGAWAGLKPAPRPWPILDEAACAWSGQCKWFAADTCQFAAASGLSRTERCVVRAVHLGFPANASTWSSVTIRQSFVLVVAVSFLACLFVPGFHRSRDVRIDSHCHIYALLLHFLHLHHGAWTFSPSRIDDCSYYWSSLIIVFPFSVAALHKLHSWL